MPYIQVDTATPLTDEQFALLREKIVDIVHESIGSARAHINAAIRILPAQAIVEAGRAAPAAAGGDGRP